MLGPLALFNPPVSQLRPTCITHITNPCLRLRLVLHPSTLNGRQRQTTHNPSCPLRSNSVHILCITGRIDNTNQCHHKTHFHHFHIIIVPTVLKTLPPVIPSC